MVGNAMMKKQLTRGCRRILVSAIAVTAVAAALCGCNAGSKFQDATVEVGLKRLRLEHFLRDGAVPEKAAFVTSMKDIPLDKPGTHLVTLVYGNQEETVKLTIQDSTVPEAVFLQERTVFSGEALKPEDFVEHMADSSGVSASFVQEPEIPEDYTDITVAVQVVDGNGNRQESQCQVSFCWMKEELVWEYGKPITKADLLYDPVKDDALVDQAQLDKINQSGVGSYTLTSSTGGKTLECRITVQDTQGPALEVKAAHTWPSQKVSVYDFVTSAEDPSGVASMELLTEINVREKGVHPVQIRAVDTLGNETLAETTIKINLDHYDPVFEGLDTDIEIEKHGTADYEAGVTVTDNIDGEISFTYDDSAVDTAVPGVYFVNYMATDEAGNETVSRRRVVVRPDESDILRVWVTIPRRSGTSHGRRSATAPAGVSRMQSGTALPSGPATAMSMPCA